MRSWPTILAAGVLVVSVNQPFAHAVSVTPEETADCRRVDSHLVDTARLPSSFTYGGRSSRAAGLVAAAESGRGLDAQRVRRTITWRDPQTGLSVRCVAVEYRDFPVIEWTLYLRNEGTAQSPLLDGLQALDARVERRTEDEFLLHHNVGSPCEARDYQPLQTALGPDAHLHIGAAGGRSTNSDMSYFNLEMPGGQGLIVAIGWPGQWASEWTRDGGRGLRIAAGQELLHTKLLPGEEIRSPLVALQFWQGDWERAQNVWRKWFIAHNIRRPGGQLPWTQWCGANEAVTNMMVFATEENVKRFVDAYVARGWQPDFWWMDAGWYPCDGDWTRTGTWQADPARFPNGMRPVTDYLHAHGMRAILWFEPERVRAGTWLATEHPEWVLPGPGDGLLDLGNPDAWSWLVEHIDGLITEFDLDIYRQDFNMDPLPYWRAHDAVDRQGITENRYVCGLLAYWDELLRRIRFVATTAPAGRRNDPEHEAGSAVPRATMPRTRGGAGRDLRHLTGFRTSPPHGAAVMTHTCRSRIAQVIGACYTPRSRTALLRSRSVEGVASGDAPLLG